MAIETQRRNHHRCDQGHKWVTWSAAWKECPHHPCPKCDRQKHKPKPVACSHITKPYANEPWWRYCPRCGVALSAMQEA